MDGLTDGIRLRRATNTAGTTWQEVRMQVKTYGQWSWAFGGGIYLELDQLRRHHDEHLELDLADQHDRERAGRERHAARHHLPAAEPQLRGRLLLRRQRRRAEQRDVLPVAVREREQRGPVHPGVSPAADLRRGHRRAPACPSRPTPAPPASTVQQAARPHTRRACRGPSPASTSAPSAPNVYFYVKSFAQIGNTIYVGGKFLQVQHGVGGPTFTQSYLAAFDKDTGEWIPTLQPGHRRAGVEGQGVARRQQAVRRR